MHMTRLFFSKHEWSHTEVLHRDSPLSPIILGGKNQHLIRQGRFTHALILKNTVFTTLNLLSTTNTCISCTFAVALMFVNWVNYTEANNRLRIGLLNKMTIFGSLTTGGAPPDERMNTNWIY